MVFVCAVKATVSRNCEWYYSIYVFPEKERRGLRPNFHIHVSVSDLYIPTIATSTYFSAAEYADRSREYINRTQKHECRNWDCNRAVPFWEYMFRFSV